MLIVVQSIIKNEINEAKLEEFSRFTKIYIKTPPKSSASAFRFVRYKNSKKVITWDALKMRVSQRHRPSEPVGMPYRLRLRERLMRGAPWRPI